MALAQQKFREMVFQILYSYDIGKPDEKAMTDMMMAELAVSKRNVLMAQERVNLILEHLSEIDSKIAAISTSYEFDRIQTVTKNILRLGVFELNFDESIPPKVAIAEAIRLARKFGTPESATFVNAILDHLYRSQNGNPLDAQTVKQTSQALLDSEQRDQQAAEEAIKQTEEFQQEE